jgi:NitT/TauT family transport system ATP-binding protein
VTSPIQISGVAKAYEGQGGAVQALARVDLDIAAGEFVTIVGPSGCGKSTLLYILGGFIPATEGTIRVGGKPVTGPGIDRGIVFQEYALFPWLTVLGNISYGLEMKGLGAAERDAIARRYISLIGLEGFEHRYPRELSGGMRQRVALARTLVYEPAVLLLDEPFGALDAQTREIMQDELLRLWRTTRNTVLMVTHDVAEAVYLSQRVCVMSGRPGRIVETFGTALDHAPGREAVMLSDQFTALRNQVWLKVREQVAGKAA